MTDEILVAKSGTEDLSAGDLKEALFAELGPSCADVDTEIIRWDE